MKELKSRTCEMDASVILHTQYKIIQELSNRFFQHAKYYYCTSTKNSNIKQNKQKTNSLTANILYDLTE